MKRSTLIELLRERARAGVGMCALVGTMRSNTDGQLTPLGAVKLAIDAFHIPLSVARELEGARCMGNAALEDNDLDALMEPFIHKALSRDT